MSKNGQKLVLVFRYLGLLGALILMIYILSQSLRSPKVFTYQADWSRTISAQSTGWYPEVRTSYQDGLLALKAEPVYWQLYRPGDYQELRVSGSVATSSEPVKLGLRQQDGSWQWQDLSGPQFSLTYNLAKAQVKRNKLELILSVPSLGSSSRVVLANDWQITFSR